jgi:hypothetical protein
LNFEALKATLPFVRTDNVVEFRLRGMAGWQRAEVAWAVVEATNALFPDRDAPMVASALMGGPSEIARRWVVAASGAVSTQESDLLVYRAIRRIQDESWLYQEAVVNGATVQGSVPPRLSRGGA